MPTSFKSLAIAWGITLLIVVGGVGLLEATYDPANTGIAEQQSVDAGEVLEAEKQPEITFRPIPVQAISDLLEMSDHGPLPVIASDGRTPFDTYSATPIQAPDAGKIAIIVTDMGKISRTTRRALANLPENTTFAFSPFGQGINGWAEQARRANHETLLMIPMEPANYPQDDPGPLTLLAAQTPDQNLNLMQASMSKLQGYLGVINNKGSRFTAAKESMRPMMQEIRARGLMYIDSQTSQYSAGPELARGMGVPIAVNSRLGFLDEELSAAVISERLDELEKIAKRDGFAVGIIRPYPVSIDAIGAWAAELETRGTVLVPISQIANQQPTPP
jgi:polysaccharide deacetylase 2 family uncharacterized protein YibQ